MEQFSKEDLSSYYAFSEGDEVNMLKYWRKDLLKDLTRKDGHIINPAQFEGEYLSTPYFYRSFLGGYGKYVSGDEDTIIFDIEPEEEEQFPELKGKSKFYLHFSRDGAVYGIIKQ